MAVWQFAVQLVPSDWFEQGNDIASLFTEDGFEPAAAWAMRTDAERFLLGLDGLLPRTKGWHPDQVVWGDEQADDIQLWREGSRVASLAARFDLRHRNLRLISGLVAFAKEHGLSLVVPEHWRNVGTDMSSLMLLLEGSGAAGYVRDPRRFLSGSGQH